MAMIITISLSFN